MCYHTRQTKTVKDLELTYNVSLSNESYRPFFDEPKHHINGFAHPNMLIIPQQKTTVITPGKWGIVPSNYTSKDINNYYKSSIKFGSGLNARCEKMFSHFLYKASIFSKRCIIPVTGFFEPFTHMKKKYPVFIHQKNDEVFSMAGIYTIIENYVTFSIITTAANPFFEGIHNIKKRQPKIFNLEQAGLWLESSLAQNKIEELLHTESQIEFEAYTINKDVFKSSVDSNYPSIIEPYKFEDLKSANPF